MWELKHGRSSAQRGNDKTTQKKQGGFKAACLGLNLLGSFTFSGLNSGS